MSTTTQPRRCQALIHKRDTYRRTGRGRTGFGMRYTDEQCSRRAGVGDFCRQHSHSKAGFMKYEFAAEFIEPKVSL